MTTAYTSAAWFVWISPGILSLLFLGSLSANHSPLPALTTPSSSLLDDPSVYTSTSSSSMSLGLFVLSATPVPLSSLFPNIRKLFTSGASVATDGSKTVLSPVSRILVCGLSPLLDSPSSFSRLAGFHLV
ncbi:hypothetical protein C8Q79DRAFT_1117196, partial [Trametes meyenii]